MPSRVQVPDSAVGKHDPVRLLVFGFVAEYLRELYEHALAVLRVNQLAGLFELGRAARAAGIQSKQTECLIRVVLYLPKDVIVDPTPRVRQPLRFGEMRFASPQSLFYALALRQVENEGNTLLLAFEARSTNQYGHAATILANVFPFKRLQAPGTLDLCQKFLAIAPAPLGHGQIGPAQAARDEILTLVSQHPQKRVIGLENGAIEVPNEDAEDISVYQPPDLRFALGKVAVQASILERHCGLRREQL